MLPLALVLLCMTFSYIKNKMVEPIIIKRFDTTIPLPEYKTAGAAGFDLSARVETKIGPKTVGYVPLNVAIQAPEGYWILLAARSSLHKKGLQFINGVGIIDADYSGDTDEYQAVLYNFSDEEVIIQKSERIVQVILLPLERRLIQEQKNLTSPDRGAFGTTGNF